MSLASEASFDHSQKWWHLSSIQLAGGIISVPVLAIGAEIASSHGIKDAFFSIILGNLIILAISFCIVLMALKNRLNAIENAEKIIGKKSGRLLAFFILITMISWLARQLFAGSELLQTIPFFSKIGIGSLIGGVASLIILFGIKGLRILCVLTTLPLIALIFILLAIINPHSFEYDFFSIPSKIDLSGTSIIIAALVASIVDYPTFFRHGKNKKNSIIALILIAMITMIIQIAGSFLTQGLIMDSGGIGSALLNTETKVILVSIFLILSMIASSAWNVYAASVGWESLFPTYKGRIEYAIIGLTATVIFNAIEVKQIVIFITNIIDIIISGIGGLLVFEFIRSKLSEKQININDIICYNIYWGIASIIGLLSYFNLLFSSSYSTLVSLLAGFLIAIFATQFRQIARWFVHR